MTARTNRAGLMLVLGLVGLTAGGCLVVGGKSVDEQGVQITNTTLAQIEPGQTTEAWLIAMLGEPTVLTSVEGQEHIRVLRYDHTVSTAEGGAVFLLWAGGSETTTTRSTFFETIDGIVTRYWTEP